MSLTRPPVLLPGTMDRRFSYFSSVDAPKVHLLRWMKPHRQNVQRLFHLWARAANTNVRWRNSLTLASLCLRNGLKSNSCLMSAHKYLRSNCCSPIAFDMSIEVSRKILVPHDDPCSPVPCTRSSQPAGIGSARRRRRRDFPNCGHP